MKLSGWPFNKVVALLCKLDWTAEGGGQVKWATLSLEGVAPTLTTLLLCSFAYVIVFQD
jgi:hypothetical protein